MSCSFLNLNLTITGNAVSIGINLNNLKFKIITRMVDFFDLVYSNSGKYSGKTHWNEKMYCICHLETYGVIISRNTRYITFSHASGLNDSS